MRSVPPDYIADCVQLQRALSSACQRPSRRRASRRMRLAGDRSSESVCRFAASARAFRSVSASWTGPVGTIDVSTTFVERDLPSSVLPRIVVDVRRSIDDRSSTSAISLHRLGQVDRSEWSTGRDLFHQHPHSAALSPFRRILKRISRRSGGAGLADGRCGSHKVFVAQPLVAAVVSRIADPEAAPQLAQKCLPVDQIGRDFQRCSFELQA